MTTGSNDEYYSFDEKEINAALEAARQPYEGTDLRAVTEIAQLDRGETEFRAACLAIVSSNHKVCLSLPLGLGRVCIPIPFSLPNGTAVRACLSIRTVWGIPTGVCVRLYVAGEQIVKKCLP